MTRLTPLPGEKWGPRERAALAVMVPESRLTPKGVGNALSTLVRHPDMVEVFLPFSSYLLLRSTLSARLRELAILRVAAHSGCAYEWTHHKRIAAKAGLSGAEIEAAGRGVAVEEIDSVVLRAADELLDNSHLSERTWSALAHHLDERQVIDLVFTIGGYTMMAMAFNALGVQPEGND